MEFKTKQKSLREKNAVMRGDFFKTAIEQRWYKKSMHEENELRGNGETTDIKQSDNYEKLHLK